MPEKYKKEGIGSGSKLSGNGLLKFFGKFTFKANSLFVLSFVLLISIILISFGLWGYKINLNENKEILVQKVEKLQNQTDLDLENTFMDLTEQIDNFKDIINKRIYSLNLLETIEELTLPLVQYNDFSVNLNELLVNLGIEADNYSSLAKQVVIFEEDPRIKSVIFSEVKLERSGLVGSDLEIILNSSFLHSK